MSDEKERLEIDTLVGDDFTLVPEGNGEGCWVDVDGLGGWLQACAAEVPAGAVANIWAEVEGWGGEGLSDYGVTVKFYHTRIEGDEEYAARQEALAGQKRALEAANARRRKKAAEDERALFEALKAKYVGKP